MTITKIKSMTENYTEFWSPTSITLVVTLATRFKFGRQKRNLVAQANILVDKIEPRIGVLCWNK